MKRSFFILIPLAVFLLSACGEDKPSDKVASDTVYKFAEQNLLEGLEIVDFVRENGWVDEQTPNRYKVRFNYNLKLVKPYPEVVLVNAKKIKNHFDVNIKKSGKGLFDINSMKSNLETMQLSTSVNQWIQNQGDNFKPRYEKFLGDCASCIAYWNSEDAPKEVNLRRQSYMSSWAHFEDLGFKDDAAIGTKIPRYAWAAFVKTEKGWQPVE